MSYIFALSFELGWTAKMLFLNFHWFESMPNFDVTFLPSPDLLFTILATLVIKNNKIPLTKREFEIFLRHTVFVLRLVFVPN